MRKNTLLLGLGLCVLFLAGCATSTRYISYTFQRYPAKDEAYPVNVFSKAQALSPANPYFVIGKVSVEGLAGSGVTPETLTNQAKQIARGKGADAIINSEIQVFHYYYGDELLRFVGELIIYAPPPSK